MFALLKRKNPYEQSARALYAAILEHIRQPSFYEGGGVPDTLDGRFELLLLHVFFVLDPLADEAGGNKNGLGQALFDVIFADMDQGLRESGIGDMGIPKHMRRMMRAFNGRMHAYREAMHGSDMQAALRRNLYGTLEAVDEEVLARMDAYASENIAVMAALPLAHLQEGAVSFITPRFNKN
ncbi:MAG: ubiquinol-cytochrome C chaperone family protein [Alphaproteobacteria bacterium]|nr:ubiquinol-cytochrome C chaperone family protein [Alphaproteobacteria bacterium]